MVTARRNNDNDRSESVADAERTGGVDLSLRVRRLSPREVAEGLEAARQAREFRETILASRGGRPLPDSAPLIRQQRAQRSRQI